ncbi:hypothetical protein [Microbacterium sp. LWH3-1.2]|uniref:hypothetical protein n=1 Tax=Microbacterium sp. LWH3-1.2 TaxID=3135256 RepID=UPI00342F1B24
MISDSGIGPIALGAPLADALALMPEGTARDTDYCEWLAWWNEGADAYDLFVTGAALTDDMPVSLVGTSARNAPAASTGPRTAEGIGVGSSVDEVRAAYPDAVETAGSVDPSIVHLRAGRIFFTYRDDPVITSVTVTSAEEPPYELCG